MDLIIKSHLNAVDTTTFQPLFFRLKSAASKEQLSNLLASNSTIQVIDDIVSQLKELIKSLNPSVKIKPEAYNSLIEEHLKGESLEEYGVWVYYPWNNKLIHLLDEQEFVEVRTNRNRYKITREEQTELMKKRVGIIGLSVGQSIALTMAMERVCGELRLADFDTAELSNLNRIRTGVQNLGLKKTIIAAREIAEIDPFLKVKLYSEGITKDTIDTFFIDEGEKLDMLVEVCDGLDIKIISRFKARELQIPVVMDTNDRGMLDIERFDLEPERKVLHGLIGDVNVEKLANLSGEEKIALVLNIAGRDSISVRGRASMIEVEQTINTWPQIASSVVLGGAVTTDVCRRILLNQLTTSGRYYIDLDDLIPSYKTLQKTDYDNPFQPLDKTTTEKLIAPLQKQNETNNELSDEQLQNILKAAIQAPSTGNDQPWKWYYDRGTLYLLHEAYRSHSFGDYKKIASLLTFGAVIENLELAADNEGLSAHTELFPLGKDHTVIAKFSFSKKEKEHPYGVLSSYINQRCTNRINIPQTQKIAEESIKELKAAAESVSGAKLKWLLKAEEIKEIGEIIGACDRIRILNPKGHEDFVKREMRWTPEDAENTKDGIDIETLGLNAPQITALGILKDPEVIRFVSDLKGGKLLEEATRRSIANAGAIGLITLPTTDYENYIKGGISSERLWLMAEKNNLALHPVISPLYLFPRILQGNGEDLSVQNIEELKHLRKKFIKLFDIDEGLAEVFLFKISYAPLPGKKSFRLPLNQVLYKR